jgi:hypothetical protein
MRKVLEERLDLGLQLFVPVLRAFPGELEDVRRVFGHSCGIISPPDQRGQTELRRHRAESGDPGGRKIWRLILLPTRINGHGPGEASCDRKWGREAPFAQEQRPEKGSSQHSHNREHPAPAANVAPPAIEESAANPVTVSVNTVVVTSGTPSLRTMALRIPIARAVSVISAYAMDGGGSPGRPSATPAAMNNSAASDAEAMAR